MWTKIFKLPLESKLKYSTGYGTSNGLSFILNAYQADVNKGKKFKLAITNENDGFDFYLGHFMIEPGYRYTFSVAASQVITTDNFDKMPPGTVFYFFNDIPSKNVVVWILYVSLDNQSQEY
jgi:hypothetical protein